jgi:pimeloyl-ACP methyl ester carboxylesterase
MSTSIQTIQGTTQLAFDSVEGITNSVQSMHDSIARGPAAWLPGRDRPTGAHGLIAGGVYAVIRGVNSALRAGADQTFRLLPGSNVNTRSSAAEIRMVAALNGALGDHLEATGNPLATPMTLMTTGAALTLEPAALAEALPQANPHLVILVHGLSLSELSWSRKGNPSIGDRLQDELDYTALYLRYNTGRHISTNGRQFAQMLEQLCEAWPVPVESLSLIGHSMGGLVIRSASWYAGESRYRWLARLRRVVCLGTPHHGSPLERAGHAFDLAMQKLPYTEPLAFGRHRSAGIKDLHHGDLLDQDWQEHHPRRPRQDRRQAVPLLEGVEYYFAAATLGRHRHDPLGYLLGDLLVRLDSAVGSHKDDLRRLAINPENCRVFHEKNHFDLLDDKRVHQQIIDWFSPL